MYNVRVCSYVVWWRSLPFFLWRDRAIDRAALTIFTLCSLSWADLCTPGPACPNRSSWQKLVAATKTTQSPPKTTTLVSQRTESIYSIYLYTCFLLLLLRAHNYTVLPHNYYNVMYFKYACTARVPIGVDFILGAFAYGSKRPLKDLHVLDAGKYTLHIFIFVTRCWYCVQINFVLHALL